MRSHAVPVPLGNIGRTKNNTRSRDSRKTSLSSTLKAMLSGAHDDHDSALRAYMPRDAEGNIDVAVIQGLGLNLQSYDTVEQRRQGTQALADLVSEAFGHQTRRQLPESLPTTGLSSRYMQYPEQLIENLPEHVPYHHDVALAPVERASVTRPAATASTERPAPRPQPVPTEAAVAPQHLSRRLYLRLSLNGSTQATPQSAEMARRRSRVGTG